jgi:hypothetical protein
VPFVVKAFAVGFANCYLPIAVSHDDPFPKKRK